MSRVLQVIVCLAILWQTCPVPAAAPNVVLILSDDQAWTDYGFMGHETIQTPHLDQLAREGALFRRGYVPSSLCRPSLATILTGLYPHQHMITSNDPVSEKGLEGIAMYQDEDFRQKQREMIRLFGQVPTLPQMLADKDYVSFQSGKWWEGHFRQGGFTGGMTHGDLDRSGRHGDEGLRIGREGMQPVFDFIDQAGQQPFFLWYAPFLPHRPHNPPDRLLDKYKDKTDSIHLARYWAMCQWFDETCGQLLDYLDQKNLSDNTLVLFVSDNGWIQQPQQSGYADRSKQSQYDGGVRSPILLRWPGKVKPGVRDELATSVDFAPTILTACGLDPTPAMQGVDLVGLAAGRIERDTIYGEIFSHNAKDIHSPSANLKYRWCIEKNMKLILADHRNVPSGEAELFDLSADPGEEHNLAPDCVEQVRRLREKIDAWWTPDAE